MSTATHTTIDTCEDVLHVLQEYNLTSATGLEAARAFQQANPGSPPRDLLANLVEQEHLTRFQSDTVLRGAANELVLSVFNLVDVLGTGSLGSVYKARSSREQGWFAIKTIPRRNVINLHSIAEKVEVLKQVRHPRVSSMIQVGAQADRVYMVWPMLEGGEKLDDLVLRQGKLSSRQAAQVAQQIASGLQAYHKAGLFHGLLKPADVVIGNDRRVRLLDFGVGFLLTCERGKSLLSTMTSGKALAKGLDCASPEAIIDPLCRTVFSDQYSLGCILYFCLTGQFPFPATNPIKKMMGHQNEEPTPISDLAPETPERMVALVKRLMQKKPEDRFASIDEVVQELQLIASGDKGSKAPGSAPVLNRQAQPAPAPAAAETPVTEVEQTQTPGTAVGEAAEERVAKKAGVHPLLILAGVAAGALAGGLVWFLNHR